MVIVVALSAIASFAIPNEEFASVFRLLKFFIILTSALMGLYGFILGLIVIAIHLSNLESFGVPYMMPIAGDIKENKAGKRDFVIRSPLKALKYRPLWSRAGNRVRLKRKEK